MDMFGGLTKTSSRIAIAAAFGLTLGGYALSSGPAKAADLGGDCCADLEERVAELEATTVRKGNRKVSVTLSGWVVKSVNWWDDGDEDHVAIGDKNYDIGTRFAITGSAQIAPGWSGGFNITVNTAGTIFGTGNQFDDIATGDGLNGNDYGDIATLYSYIYIKSDTWGTLNWGHLSPASDNPAVLADLSGTVIQSNGVWFEGAGMILRPSGGPGGKGGLASGFTYPGAFGADSAFVGSALTWGAFVNCQGLGAGIGLDCWGVAQPAVRYDSPTWGGFRFEASYGNNQATGPHFNTNDSDFADIALFYTADWNSIKLSAAGAYTWIESAALASSEFADEEVDLFQVGASILHKPSGLGIFGQYQAESTNGRNFGQFGWGFCDDCVIAGPDGGFPEFFFVNQVFPAVNDGVEFAIPDTDAWYVKPFWRKTWGAANGVGLGALGATTFYGEYGQYNDMYQAGRNLCFAGFPSGTNIGTVCSTGDGVAGPHPGAGEGVFVTGSEAERWGLGVVQEIDSAAMQVWFRWQHQTLDVDLVHYTSTLPGTIDTSCPDGCSINQSFDDWDLFQFGGIIFF
jgi:hypothetical protein